nr:MAG: hypothetical protein DIU70_09360 [Bacillota bacterium]
MMRPLRPTAVQQALAVGFTGIMTGALLFSLAGFWRQSFPPGPLLAVAGGAAALGWLGWRRPGLLTLLLTLTLLGGLGLPIAARYAFLRWHWTGLDPAAARVEGLLWDLAEWAGHVRRGQFETMPPAVAWFFLALSGLGAALFILREALGRGETFWSLVAGAGVFGFQWVLYWDAAQPYLMAYVAAGVLLWSVVHPAHRMLRWAREGWRVNHLPGWTGSAVAGLGIVLLAAALPTYEATDLGALAEDLRAAFPALQRLRGGSGSGGLLPAFGLRQVGFGGDADALGGPVVPDDRVALRVRLDQRVDGPLYLRGTVHTEYDGRGWELPMPADRIEVAPDQPLPSAYHSQVPRQYLRVSITPVTLRTATLFSPLEPALVIRAPGPRLGPEGALVASRVPEPGETYEVMARVGRTSAQQVRELTQPGALPAHPDNAPPELLPYLWLPDGPALTEVRRLAEAITAPYDHPFDKAVALEAYLREQYPYRLDVPFPPRFPPEGWDFVHHFLFEVRAGYCTYHSTAMAVMLRTLGIPARWVQGFAVYPGEATEVAVRNRDAHAWVEAYFPGYGWVIFDPTPRGDIPPPDRSYVPPPTSETGLEDPFLNDPTLNPENRPATPSGVEPDPGPTRGDGTSAAGPGLARSWLRAAALALGALAVLLVLFGALRLRTGIAWRQPDLAVQQAYEHLTRLLGQFGYGPLPSQTPREYLGALTRSFPELYPALVPLVTAYEQVRYGPPDAAPPPEAAAAAQGALAAVRERLRERFGPVYYLWRRLTVWQPGSHLLPGSGAAGARPRARSRRSAGRAAAAAPPWSTGR